MIPVTDEMVQLALDVFLATPTDSIAQIDAGMAKALAAVLALVERDHLRPTPGPDRCSACGRTSRELKPVHEGGQVVARYGPSCWRRYLAASPGRQALPIGGER